MLGKRHCLTVVFGPYYYETRERLAQLDRAPASGAGGREFESRIAQRTASRRSFFFWTYRASCHRRLTPEGGRGESDMDEPGIPENDRLEALEVKASFQESAIAELSTVIYEQDQRIERLERMLKDLASRLKEVAQEGLPAMPPGERPPHY